MCNAFKNIGLKVLLLVPYKGLSLRANKRVFKEELGVELMTDLSFYKLTSNNRLLNKYFNWLSVWYALQTVDAKVFFVRNVTFTFLLKTIRKPFIYESHNNKLHLGNPIIDKLLKRLLINAVKSDYCLIFISISKALMNHWIETGISESKSIALHDGYDSNKFPYRESSSVYELDFDFPDGKLVCTYTGSLFPDRGVDLILLLAKRFPEIIFIIAGGPEYRKNFYANQVKDCGLTNIMFIGPIPHHQIPELLHRSHLLLALWSWRVPTILYCSPLKIFEYMASGKLIIAESYPSIVEVLDENTAVLVEPENFVDLSQKVQYVQNNFEHLTHGKLAREKAKCEYSWNTRVKNIIEKVQYIL